MTTVPTPATGPPPHVSPPPVPQPDGKPDPAAVVDAMEDRIFATEGDPTDGVQPVNDPGVEPPD